MIGTGFLFQTHWDKKLLHLRVTSHLIMYDQLYVKKRRRRKIAAIVALFSAIGVTALVIVAFLGRTVGSFTISLRNTDVSLSLSEKADFNNPSSYIHLPNLKGLRETTYESILAKGVDLLDSDKTDYYYGQDVDEQGNMVSLEFIKCTFYIRNTGNSSAQYNLSINITDRTESKEDNSENVRILDDTLRVMVFENDASVEGSHEKTVYAKEAKSPLSHKDINGNPTSREFIGEPSYTYQEDEAHPLAESFLSGKTVAKYTAKDFRKGDVKRYTIVLWLEGFDPESKPDQPYPKDATIKLGVNIAAYENPENE